MCISLSKNGHDAALAARGHILRTLRFTLRDYWEADDPALNTGAEAVLAMRNEPDAYDPVATIELLERNMSNAALAAFLFACWEGWDEWAADTARSWAPARPHPLVTDSRLEIALEVTRLLGRAGDDILSRSATSADLANALGNFATALSKYGQAAFAVDFLVSALGAVHAPEEANRLSSQLLGLIAENEELRNTLPVALLARAQAFIETTPDDCGSGRIVAFDAFWAALRTLDNPDGPSQIAATLLQFSESREYLEVFRDGLRSLVDPSIEVDNAMALYSRTRWKLDEEESVSALLGVSGLIAAIDDRRRKLFPSQESAFTESSWTTWSFDWPAYPASVPLGRALDESPSFDDQLLHFRHETIHVASMTGRLMLPNLALRLATVDACLDLHARLQQMGEQGEIDGSTLVPALSTKDLIALGDAERALELLRKTQVLQAAWSPVLEGIAVFGELHADVRDDHATSVVDDVISQFLSDAIDPDDDLDYISLVDAAGERVRRAQDIAGRWRIRTYLNLRPAQYLAGYIAVRGVVAGWREKLGGLDASRAFRVLLHAVRNVPTEALPDLSLPIDRFADEAQDRFAAWLDGLASLPPDDVRRLAEDLVPLEWLDGRLVDLSGDASQRANDEFSAQYAQALRSMVGPDRASVERLADEGEARLWAAWYAKAQTLREHLGKHALTFAGPLSRQADLLPIGEATAPFWLVEGTQALAFSVRVVDRGEGQPGGYQGQLIPLDDHEWAGLQSALTSHPEARLRVARVADLGNGSVREGRGNGRQMLVLSLGPWTHVRNLGAFTSSGVDTALRDAAVERLVPEARVRLERDIASRGRFAVELARWLKSPGPWTAVGVRVDVDAWACRVLELAEACVSERADETRDRVSNGLLGAYDLCEGGLRGVAESLGIPLGDLADLLFASGRAPAPADWAVEGAMEGLMTKFSTGWDVSPWPGAAS